MNIRLYKLYPDSQLSLVVKSITTVLAAWSGDWMSDGSSSAGTEVIALADCAQPEVHWLSYLVKDIPSIAIGCNAAWPLQLQTLMIGNSVEASQTARARAVLQDLSQAALGDLVERMLKAAGLGQKQDIDPTPGLLSDIPDLPGSAHIALQAKFSHTASIILLLAPDIIDAILGPYAASSKTPVLPLSQALDQERVVLEAVVGQGELTLDELRTLAPGDVIPLRRNVNQEIVLQLDSDTPVCGGFLGNAHGRLAVQLKSL